jgi:hypothetical protein
MVQVTLVVRNKKVPRQAWWNHRMPNLQRWLLRLTNVAPQAVCTLQHRPFQVSLGLVSDGREQFELETRIVGKQTDPRSVEIAMVGRNRSPVERSVYQAGLKDKYIHWRPVVSDPKDHLA